MEQKIAKLPLPRLLVTNRPNKQPRKRKTVEEKVAAKKLLDQARGQTRVNIGVAFQRWRQLKELKGLKTDTMVADFLLDSFSKVTSLPLKVEPEDGISNDETSESISKVTSLPPKAERLDWVPKDEASDSALDDQPLQQDDAVSAPVEIELVLTKSMTNEPLAGSHEDSRDVQTESFTIDSTVNLSGTRYMTLTKEHFLLLMFRCLECSSECLIRAKGRGGDLTFRQECLICSYNRLWTSQAADIPDNKGTECSPCGDAHELLFNDMPMTGQKHITGSSRWTCENSAEVEKDSIAMRGKNDSVRQEEQLSLLMETHEDNDEEDHLNISLIRPKPGNPNYPESSDMGTATVDLFIDECSDKELSENESDKSSQEQQGDDFDMYQLISTKKENVSTDEEMFTDEDRSKELVEKASDTSFENIQEDWEDYLPSSSDTDMENSDSSDGCDDETSDNVKTKKPFQNTIKPVIWCTDCESVAKMHCMVKRHKRNYCCAACVSVDNVENLSFKDFSIYFSDITSFHLHAIAEHCGSEKLYEHKICQDCNKNIRVETDPNKRGHVCEYKIKPFSCDLCPKRFISENGRKSHYRRLHGEYQHACKYCMLEFNTKQSKLEHEQSHNEDMLYYTCPNCPEKFTDFFTRKEHLKTHPAQRNFCSLCNRKFTEFNRYERHLRIHSGEKPYKCDVCERSFSQNGHLKSHMRVHTGEKPFLCEHCGESFNHNISLRNHRQKQHGITDSSSVPGEENKQIGRPIRNKDKPRRHRKICCPADAEKESCESDSDDEQKRRGRKRKSRRKE